MSSRTAREFRSPPPRRKSCIACVKAKRRCDFAPSACLRCVQRKEICEYPSDNSSGPRHQSSRSPLPGSIQASSAAEKEGEAQENTPSSSAAAATATPPNVQSETGTGEVDMANNTAPTAYPADPSSIYDFMFLDSPADHAAMLIDPGLMCGSSVLAPPTTTTREVDVMGEAMLKRLLFVIEEVRKVPETMVASTQTPWCHPLLYRNEMPCSIRHALSACALYLSKNRVNQPVIFQAIEAYVAELLDSAPPTGFLETLARTQSLIMYHIIRLVDEDIRARASADRINPALERSAVDLLSHVRFEIEDPGDLPLHPLAPTKAFWHNWILQESARRTVLFSLFFLRVYQLISGQRAPACVGRLGFSQQWTLSSHLWGSCTAVEFATAWKQQKHFVVTDERLEKVVEDAMAEDVDSFGRLWISCFLGVDEAEGWFASRGGSLRTIDPQQ